MLLKRSALSTLAALSLVSFSDLRSIPAIAQPTPTVAPTVQPAPESSIASILPAETLGVAFIQTQDDRWRELSQFQLFPDGLTFPGTLFYPKQGATSFEQDIQPWLGDQFGVAMLSAKNILTISTVKDQTALNRYVTALKGMRSKAPKETQYKGATILEFEAEKSKPQTKSAPTEENPVEKVMGVPSEVPKYAIAILPNYFISASSTEAIQELLDGQGKLTENPKFQKVQQNPRAARSLVTLYGKYVELIKAVDQYNRAQLEQIRKLNPNAPMPPLLDPSMLDPLAKFYDTAEGYIWAEPAGLRAQFAVNLTQSIPVEMLTPLTTRNEILNQLPEVNYMVANSKNLALYWQVLTAGLNSQPTWKKQLEQGRQTMQNWVGVDDRDILPWMNGEYVLFAYPTRKGFIPSMAPNMDIAFGMMFQTNDREAAEAGLKKFNEFVTPRLGNPMVQQSTIAGQPVTTLGAVEKGRSLNFFSHGWTDDQTVLMLFGGGSISEFSPKPTRTLTQSANFKAAIAPFPDANLGYFYVNQGAFMSFLNTALFPVMFGTSKHTNPFVTQIQDSLSTIRSISGASAVKENQVQFEGYLSLSPRMSR